MSGKLTTVQTRYEWLRENCSGFCDPEERCPRDPSKCVCWKVRQDVEGPPPEEDIQRGSWLARLHRFALAAINKEPSDGQ